MLTNFQVSDVFSNCRDSATWLMPEDHGWREHKVSYTTMLPVVHIAPTNANRVHLYLYLCRTMYCIITFTVRIQKISGTSNMSGIGPHLFPSQSLNFFFLKRGLSFPLIFFLPPRIMSYNLSVISLANL